MSLETLEDRLVWLLQLSRQMLSTRDLETLLPLIVDAYIDTTRAARGIVYLVSRDSGQLLPECRRDAGHKTVKREFGRSALSVAQQVRSDNKPAISTEAGSEGPARFTVTWPLATEQDVVGVVHVEGSADTLNRDGIEDKVLSLLGEHCAAAIENARIFERATNDPLTGLPNNSYFMVQLAKAMRNANAEAGAGVLLVDLDAFKRINLAGGASAGDSALIDVGGTLQDIARADGLVARYSSDKFAILLSPEEGMSIEIRLRDVAERARAAVGTKTYHGVRLTASIGGASFPKDELESAPDLVAAADKVLSTARARGHGEIEIA